MTKPTRPFLVLHVAWHPGFEDGATIASALYSHFRRELHQSVSGGAGISLVYRYAPEDGTGVPRTIDTEDGETTAIVLLLDDEFADDPGYMAWARQVIDQADASNLRVNVFPVAIGDGLRKASVRQQAVRWDKWGELGYQEKQRRLTSDLTHQLCRMLRLYLERLRHPDEDSDALEQYLKKVQIFLSHSKHDPDGERIAKATREALFADGGLGSFFDVKDIPAGLPFDRVILSYVKVSAVVAIHTDSYSSREWCRREILEAKRHHVPLVIANCISDVDDRGFPYMGNVPVVRMDPAKLDRIEFIVGRLLDEVLKDFLWKCRVEMLKADNPDGVVFLPRLPELISLAGLETSKGKDILIVYPDPPLGSEEQRLFEEIAPSVKLRSLIEFIAAPRVTATSG